MTSPTARIRKTPRMIIISSRTPARESRIWERAWKTWERTRPMTGAIRFGKRMKTRRTPTGKRRGRKKEQPAIIRKQNQKAGCHCQKKTVAAFFSEQREEIMRFRPCIDIHNGKVKQIVGGSLRDEGGYAQTNFASEQSARFYAEMYKNDGLTGGHIILLNPADSPHYEQTRMQALDALAAYPDGMQIGGGITPENAGAYLEAGASHVIVTSYVFRDGTFHRDRLDKLVRETGREHLVLDLS